MRNAFIRFLFMVLQLDSKPLPSLLQAHRKTPAISRQTR